MTTCPSGEGDEGEREGRGGEGRGEIGEGKGGEEKEGGGEEEEKQGKERRVTISQIEYTDDMTWRQAYFTTHMHVWISGNGKRLVESHSIFSVSSSRSIHWLLHFRVGLTAGASTTVSDAGWCLM